MKHKELYDAITDFRIKYGRRKFNDDENMIAYRNHGINWFIEFYNENGNHMEHCGECISGFNDNPLKRAVERAKWWNCKSICIVF